MDVSPRLGLPYIAPQQAQKQVTYNEAIRALDVLVQPAVKSRTIASPPGSPLTGDTYIVGPAGSGAWASQDGKIATYVDGGWSFRAPASGWLTYVNDSAQIAVHQSGAWAPLVTTGGSSVAKFGINAAADLINRLAVASEASLFTHDGTNHRLKVNKNAAAHTASVLFQTGFTAHAEFGLVGDDDFRLKVSDNGTTWFDAVTIARTTGALSLPAGQIGFPATQNPSANPNTLDDYEEGTWTPAVSFGGAAVGVTYGAPTFGRYTKIGRLCTIACSIALTSKGSSTGSATIAGLPFSPQLNPVASAAVGYAGGLSITGSVVALVVGGSDTINLYASLNGSSTQMTSAHFTNSSSLYISASYDVS